MVIGRITAALAAASALAALGWSVAVRAGATETKPPSGAKATLRELKPGFAALDLSESVNGDAITDVSDREESDFDAWGQSFPAEDLPESGLFEPKGANTAFLFPTKDRGKKNNVVCVKQTLALSGKARELHFLAATTDGEQEEKLTIVYADGEATTDFKVPDWCQTPQFGAKEGVASAHRIAAGCGGGRGHGKETRTIRIFVVSIAVGPERELKSLKLPNNPFIHIFAITLVK